MLIRAVNKLHGIGINNLNISPDNIFFNEYGEVFIQNWHIQKKTRTVFDLINETESKNYWTCTNKNILKVLMCVICMVEEPIWSFSFVSDPKLQL